MRSKREALADAIGDLIVGSVAFESEKWNEINVPVLVESIFAILADVQPEPAPASGTIDRKALEDLKRATRALALELPAAVWDDYTARLDRVLALVRPAEGGVVLTREEARLAARALSEHGAEPSGLDYSDSEAMDALAERLEAAS